jgi:hypothetical protein
VGQLVKVADGGAVRDGIVFDLPSHLKVVVALVDPRRGPVFRTVHPKTLAERLEEGPDDPALRRLLRRTPCRPMAEHEVVPAPGTDKRVIPARLCTARLASSSRPLAEILATADHAEMWAASQPKRDCLASTLLS